MPQPTLTTARLILRPFRLADARRVQQLAGKRQIAENVGTIPHPYPDGAAEEWISTLAPDYDNGKGAVFAITLRPSRERPSGERPTAELIGSDVVIGAIGIGIDSDDHRGEMGYWLGVNYWNNGYVTEAARAVCAFGFDQLELNRIYASHFTRNPASGRVMQKVGMTYEGTFRQHFYKWGKYEDLAYYGLLKSDWLQPQFNPAEEHQHE